MNRKFYVASLSMYVLVEAANAMDAYHRGLPALEALAAEMGRHVTPEVLVIRPATHDEIELDAWTQEALAIYGR